MGLPQLLIDNRELIQALSPIATAVIALVAVVAAMINTRIQIIANAKNVDKQLKDNNESLSRQLESQARESESNRQAQLQHAIRAQRRDTLIKAAEVAQKIQVECTDLYQMRYHHLFPELGVPPKHEASREKILALSDRIDAVRSELHFVAVTLEVEGLVELAENLRTYDFSVDDYIRNTDVEDEAKAISTLRAACRELISQFGAALRIEA